MKIQKKNIKKVEKKPVKQKLENSESDENELEIQNALAHFEAERRKQFEATLVEQKMMLETKMRGQIPQYKLDNKNYKIQFLVISSRIKDRPIVGFEFDVAGSFNEFSFEKTLLEGLNEYLKSDKFRKVQKKEYYKLRLLGVEPAEIYPQIEMRWVMMDDKEKLNFRKMLRQDFTRRIAKQKGNKKGDLFPHSK